MKRTASILLVVFVVWLGAHAAQTSALSARASWPVAEEFVLVPPPEIARIASGGYNELWADLRWVQTLVYYGTAKIGQSDFRYLGRLIDNILALDPYFHDVYYWAAAASTYKQERATQEEFRTSVRYLRLGLERFPEDYELHEALVMKLWWDLEPEDPAERRRNRLEAARIAERAMRLPKAPPGTATRIAAMWSDLGEIEHARNTLRQMLLTTENKQARAKMIARFRYLAESEGEAELLAKAKREFDSKHAENLPGAPSDLFVILGPRRKRWPTLDELTSGTLLGQLRLLEDEGDEDALDQEAPEERR